MPPATSGGLTTATATLTSAAVVVLLWMLTARRMGGASNMLYALRMAPRAVLTLMLRSRRPVQATAAMTASAAVVLAAHRIRTISRFDGTRHVEAAARRSPPPPPTGNDTGGGGVVGTLRSLAVTSAQFIDRQRDMLQLALEKRLEKRLDDIIQLFADKVKDALRDPDMPRPVQSLVDETVDKLLPDIRRELYSQTSKMLLTPVKRLRLRQLPEHAPGGVHASGASARGGVNGGRPDTGRGGVGGGGGGGGGGGSVGNGGGGIASGTGSGSVRRPILSRARAFVLYRVSPHNKSIWACFRSRTWWLLNAIGLIPTVNHVWWMLLFVMKDKTDEYQVCDFIIGFESAKFFSVGMWSLLVGGLRSHWCLMADPHTCDTTGPRLAAVDALAFFVQIMLVWAAYWMLPFTKRRRPPRTTLATPGPKPAMKRPPPPPSSARVPVLRRWFSRSTSLLSPGTAPRGGYLRRMFWYHTGVVAATLTFASFAFYVHGVQWKLLASLYWVRVVYGLLAVPFVVFKAPMVTRLFVCPTATGYDPLGNTTLACRPARPPSKPGGGADTAAAGGKSASGAAGGGKSASGAATPAAGGLRLTPSTPAGQHASEAARVRRRLAFGTPLATVGEMEEGS